MLKKLTAMILLGGMLCGMTACGGGGNTANEEKAPAKIGISQYGEHASLDNCREGFLQGLKDAGLEEGKDYTIDYKNAGFDDNVAIQIGQSFSADNVDLMCAIATPSATACFAAAEDKDIPVIFTAITDPVEAGLHEGNITGTSDQLPITGQMELIRKMLPEAKVIGIVYTTSEPNSVSAIREYRARAAEYGFEIDAIGVTAQSEVVQAVDTLLSHNVDCLSNLTDNNVVGVLSSILEKTYEKKIPVFGSEIEQVKLGCAAAAGLDYYKLGQQTGEMAAKIIRGEATCAEMPYEVIKEYNTYVNVQSCDELGIAVPTEVMEIAITDFE